MCLPPHLDPDLNVQLYWPNLFVTTAGPDGGPVVHLRFVRYRCELWTASCAVFCCPVPGICTVHVGLVN